MERPNSRAWRAVATLALFLGSVSPISAAVHAGDDVPLISIAGVAPGVTIDLHRFRGKPVYLNAFASWCPPCNAEAPTVRRLAAKYRGRGLVTVGADEGEDAVTAAAFARNYHWPFSIGNDRDLRVSEALGIEGLPIHLFIARNGKVSTLRLGEMGPDEIEAAIVKIVR